MRRGLVLTLIFIFWGMIDAAAEDVLLGKVVSFDQKNRKLLVAPLDTQKKKKEKPENENAEYILVEMNASAFLKSIREGDIVRLWGSFVKPDTPPKVQPMTFRAGMILPGLPGPADSPMKNDPTGVRQRLQKAARIRHGPGMARPLRRPGRPK